MHLRVLASLSEFVNDFRLCHFVAHVVLLPTQLANVDFTRLVRRWKTEYDEIIKKFV